LGNIRSTAEFVAAAIFLGAALVVNCAALAQIPGNGDGKRIVVLRIVEVGSAQANSLKRSRPAAIVTKKKVAGRTHAGRTRSTAVDAAPIEPDAAKQIAHPESPIPTVESGAPEGINSTQPSMEQTGILSFGDRAVAFASFSNEGDDVGLLTNDILRATESQAVHGSVIENSKNIAQEASQSGARTDQEAPGARSRSIYPMLAIFSGAILAGFGLVSSRGRRETRELAGNTYPNAV
jgi:hypothetical protein